MNRLVTTDREDGKRDQFGYNYGSEMTSAQYGLVGGVNPNRTVGYTLDLVGNRNQTTDTTAATQSYTPNTLNQYTGNVGTSAITNGSEHEVSNYQGVAYQYINGGRLTHVTSSGNVYDIKYDALGRAVIRTLNNQTTYYLYDGEKALNEAGYNNATNVYGLGVDENVIRFEPSNVYYFYQDHEGSVTHVRAVTTGATIESYRYDAFGQPTIKNASGTALTTSAINNRFMFTGREWAPVNLGFYEYRARAYHPGLGRFMSEDPKGFDAGDYNLYRYCGNDPEDRVDPSGMIAGIFSPSGDWAGIASNGYLDSGAQGAHGDGSSPKADQAGSGSDAGAVDQIQISDDALRQDYEKARENKSSDPQIRSLFERTDRSNVKLVRSDSYRNSREDVKGVETTYRDKAGHITRVEREATGSWNPRAGLRTPDGRAQSPATALVHILDHVDRILREGAHAYDVAHKYPDSRFGNAEDRRVITGLERRAAEAHSPHEGIRTDGRGAYFGPVRSVLDTGE